MKKKIMKAVLFLLLLLCIASEGFARAAAEQANVVEYDSETARHYILEEKSHRGHTVTARFHEIAKDEFKIAIVVYYPPGYSVNDDILEFFLYINDKIEVTASYVTYIYPSDIDYRRYDVFYGAVHFDGEITSIRLVPEWGKGGKLDDEIMHFLDLR
jgi:hypothetical protein